MRLRWTAFQYDQRKANTPIANNDIAVTAPTHWANVEKSTRGVSGGDAEDHRQDLVGADDPVAVVHRRQATDSAPTTLAATGRPQMPSAAPSRAASTE